MSTVPTLVAGILARDRRVIARALRWAEEQPTLGRALAKELREAPRAYVLGVTGQPGAGKSTLVDELLVRFRADGHRVAVLCVDPTSPFSGGALLGDRIRMSRHATDDDVFIRSLATRGALGGLAAPVFDSVRILEGAGFDVVIVETVGVGQDEVDIAELAHTTLVVLVPGFGDDVQALKAGLLEIADVFVLNKADRAGIEDLERHIRQMQGLGPKTSWIPPSVRTVASRGEGLVELSATIALHRAHLGSPAGAARLSSQRRALFERLVRQALWEETRTRLSQEWQDIRVQVESGAIDPYVAAEQISARFSLMDL